MTTELAFIAALRKLPLHSGARGLDDDCAVLEVGGETLVLTHDAMAEGIHFLPMQDPADVAWKLVATNMSDLASKGAEPVGVLLGYMLGENDTRFLEGMAEALGHFNAPLLGGDTVSGSGHGQSLGLTAIGRATHRPVPSRSGARAGDALWLTGPIGAAMAGFEALKAGSGDSAAYRRPCARMSEGMALAPQVTAMMDVSDGLLLDSFRMATASQVTLAIEAGSVPLGAPPERLREALRWGDDYELLFTLPPGIEPPVKAFRIGEVRAKGDAPLLLDGQPLQAGDQLGYQHR